MSSSTCGFGAGLCKEFLTIIYKNGLPTKGARFVHPDRFDLRQLTDS